MTQHDNHRQRARTERGAHTQKVYSRPRIVHELPLETRAGSPLSIPNPLDPAGIDPAD